MSLPACSIIHPTGSVGNGVNHSWRWAYSDAFSGMFSAGSDLTKFDWAMSRRISQSTTHIAPSSMHPPRRPAKRSNTPSRIIAPRNTSARVVHAHEVLGAQVLAAAEPVGDGAAVVVEPAAGSGCRRRRCAA